MRRRPYCASFFTFIFFIIYVPLTSIAAPFIGEEVRMGPLEDITVWAEIECSLLQIDDFFFAEEQDIYKNIYIYIYM